MKKLILLALLLMAPMLMAADNEPQDQQQDEVTADAEASTEQSVEPDQTTDDSNELILAEVEDETDAEAVEQSSRRFIPTEQISQDLGVSFPVDI